MASQGIAVHNSNDYSANLPPGTSKVIQDFADHYNARVVVVGSRAAGTANQWSDFDYLIDGNSRARQKAMDKLPRGMLGGQLDAQGNPTGIDIWNIKNKPLDASLPHIIFSPTNPIK